MDIKHLRPRVFVADPENGDSKRQWKHWFKSFTTYIAQMQNLTEADKLNLLVNHIDAAVYEIISEAASFEDAVELLSHTYAKSPSPVFARYALMTCKQKTGESLDSYFQKLKRMSIDCDFQAVTALIHKEEAIRYAFIGGLVSNEIRQRLLENNNLTLQAAFDKARSLETAQKNAEMYLSSSSHQTDSFHIAKLQTEVTDNADVSKEEFSGRYSYAINAKCSYCGNNRHSRKICPARNAMCYTCSKRGHFAKMCRSNSYNASSSKNKNNTSAMLKGIEATTTNLKVNVEVSVNGKNANALIDTGSTKRSVNV